MKFVKPDGTLSYPLVIIIFIEGVITTLFAFNSENASLISTAVIALTVIAAMAVRFKRAKDSIFGKIISSLAQGLTLLAVIWVSSLLITVMGFGGI